MEAEKGGGGGGGGLWEGIKWGGGGGEGDCVEGQGYRERDAGGPMLGGDCGDCGDREGTVGTGVQGGG